MYSHFKAYVEEKGTHSFVRSYRTKEGFDLASWVTKQRKAFNKGSLSTARILKLEAIGFIWDIKKARYDEGLSYLSEYFKEFGNSHVHDYYKTEDGFTLGRWVTKQRKDRRKGVLDEQKILLLDGLNFIWEPSIGNKF